MADIGGLQLLPETRKKIELKVPGQTRPLVLGMVFLIIVLAAYFGLLTYKNSVLSSVANVDGQLADLERSRDKKLESDLLATQQQLSVVNPLLASHLIWSDAFGKIQKITQPQVQFQSIDADFNSRKIIFKALTANYTTLAKQVAAFYSDDSISDLTLSKVTSLPTGRIEFSMQLNFDVKKFLLAPPPGPSKK